MELEPGFEIGEGGGEDGFGGADAFEFAVEGGGIGEFGDAEGGGGEIDEGEAEAGADAGDGGEVVMTFRGEEAFVGVGAGAEDLGDGALDEFARAGFLDLVADGDLASGLEEAGDVGLGGMIGQAAHGDALALGEGEVEEGGAGFGIFEEEFVEVAEAEEEEGVAGHFAADAKVLGHHGRGLGAGLSGHGTATVTGERGGVTRESGGDGRAQKKRCKQRFIVSSGGCFRYTRGRSLSCSPRDSWSAPFWQRREGKDARGCGEVPTRGARPKWGRMDASAGANCRGQLQGPNAGTSHRDQSPGPVTGVRRRGETSGRDAGSGSGAGSKANRGVDRSPDGR